MTPTTWCALNQGAWYGWPEYFDSRPVNAGRFNAVGKPKPTFIWKEHPPLTKPFATFQTHSGVNGMAFAPAAFGFEGDAFVAMFGAFVPLTTGVNVRPAGSSVVRVDMKGSQVHEFAANVLPGPSFVNRQGGFDRPSDVAFAPDGSLYVVDWGSSTITAAGLKLVPQTGVIWRIYPERMAAARPGGPMTVQAAPVPESERQPEVRNVPELYRMLKEPLALILGAVLVVVLGLIWLVRKGRAAVRPSRR